MYAQFYGLTIPPFQLTPDARFFYESTVHRQAMAYLVYGLHHAEGFIIITGEVGAGKTVAVRAATAALDASRHALIYLAQPGTGVRGIYVEIVRALGATPCFQRSNLVPQTIELLAAEETERGKKVVLIVDEAHLLSPEQLESLRLLGNSEMDSHSPFSCLILGQPTLRRRIRLGSFAALDQRIALRYHLDGMDLAETAGYVKHHVGLAGRSDPLFSDDAVALIHQTARGIPRAVNNLAVHSLVAAFADSKGLVDESSARAAVVEVNGD